MSEQVLLPLAFGLAAAGRRRSARAPILLNVLRPRPSLTISGVTRSYTGAALGGCVVMLFRTATDELVESGVSDGSGAFSFGNVGPGQSYYVVAYLPGSPDVAGTTVNTLVGSS
jgi:hypothetical protein